MQADAHAAEAVVDGVATHDFGGVIDYPLAFFVEFEDEADAVANARGTEPSRHESGSGVADVVREAGTGGTAGVPVGR